MKTNQTKGTKQNARQRQLTCDICKSQFRCKANLEVHLRSHAGEKPCLCDLCGRGFSQLGSLNRHRQLCQVLQGQRNSGQEDSDSGKHTREKHLQCHICEEVFEYPRTLKSHMYTHIEGETLHHCLLCEKKYPNKGALQSHLLVHNGVRPFKCKICYKKFTQNSHRNVHMRTFHCVQSHECEECRKKFPSKSNLLRHMKLHTGIKQYRCDVCKREFLQRYELTKHMQYIENGNQHKCENCDQLFCTFYDLRIHLKKHSQNIDLGISETNDRTSLRAKENHCENNGNVSKEVSNQGSENECLKASSGDSEDIDYNDVVTSELESDKPMYVATKISLTNDINDQSQNEQMFGNFVNCNNVALQTENDQDIEDTKMRLSSVVGAGMENEQVNSGSAMLLKAGQSQSAETAADIPAEDSKANTVTHVLNNKSDACKVLSQNKQRLSEEIISELYTGSKDHQDKPMHKDIQIVENSFSGGQSNRTENKLDTGIDGHVNFVSEQNTKYQQLFQGNTINICSQDNYKLRPFGGSYQSAQLSCVVKICGEKGIGTMQTKQNTVSNNIVSVCQNSASQMQHNKKDVLISGGMPDIHDVCKMYTNTCEQKIDQFQFESTHSVCMNDKSKEMPTVESVQYGPVNILPASVDTVEFGPENIYDVRYDINKSSTPVKYGPANIFDGELGPTNINDTKFDLGHRSVSPIHFGPSNISDLQYGHKNLNELHFGEASKSKDELSFHGNELNDDSNVNRVKHGPENLNEVFYGPANLNDIPYSSAMLNDMQYDPASSHKQQCSPENLNNVQCGPRDWNDVQGIPSSLDEVHYGPENLNEIEYGPVNLNDIQFGPANFNEVASDPSGICDVQYKPTSFDEELLIPFGPQNIYDLKEDNCESVGNTKLDKTVICSTNSDHKAKEEKAVTDILNSSLMNFPHLNSKVHDHSDIFHGQVASKQQCSTDYTTVGGLNLGPVHELTDMIVHSCEQAASSAPYKAVSGNKVLPDKVPIESERTELRVLNETLVWNTVNAEEGVPTKQLSKADESNLAMQKEVSTNQNETLAATSELSSIVGGTVKKSTPEEMVGHHTITSDNSFLCEICSKVINSKQNMTQHMLTHSKARPFSCKICSKAFTGLGSLNHHYKLCKVLNINDRYTESSNSVNSSNEESQFVCNFCKERFSQKCLLKRHMVTHVKQRLYKCETCSELFRTKGTLQSHLRTHTGEKPFKCHLCEKSYQQNSQLTVHIRAFHTKEKPFVCSICTKTFSDRSNYNRHMSTHSGEKSFVCEVCKKSFGQKCNLKKHMLIHSEVKTDVCDICDKSFSTKANLKRHMLSHTVT